MFLSFLIYRKRDFNKLSDIPYLAILIIFMINFWLINLFALHKELHYMFSVDFTKLFIIFGLAYKLMSTKKILEQSIWAYFIGAAYVGYEAYVVGRDEMGRVEGIGMVDAPESNGTAAALVAAFPLLTFYFWKTTGWKRFFIVILGALIANGIVLINSRGSFLGTAGGMVFFLCYLFFGKVKVKRQRLVAIGLVILGLMGALIVMDDSFTDRMLTLTKTEDKAASGSHRTDFWVVAVKQSFEFPFGYGAYGFEELSPYYIDEKYFDRGKSQKAVHSIWFQALSEVGWIGFSLWMLIIFSTFRMIRRVKKHFVDESNNYDYYLMVALQSALIGELIASSFINQFRVQIIYLLLLFILVMHTLVMKKNWDDHHLAVA
jgi:hypothetical protein